MFSVAHLELQHKLKFMANWLNENAFVTTAEKSILRLIGFDDFRLNQTPNN